MSCGHVAYAFASLLVLTQGARRQEAPATAELTCANLGVAFLSTLPIACVPGLSVIPAVALGICCPAQSIQSVKTWASGTLQKIGDLKQTDAERFLQSVQPRLNPAEAQAKAEADQRALITELYTTLLVEHDLRNAESTTKQIMSKLKKHFGLHSQARFSKSAYVLNSQTRHDTEIKFPWVLYPRLVAAYNDKRLSGDEQTRFVYWIRQLKEEYSWLPDLPPDLGSALDDEMLQELYTISKIKESQVPDPAESSGKGWMRKQHSRLCDFIGHQVSKPVMAMKKLTQRPSDLQLKDVATRVLLLEELLRYSKNESSLE